MSRFTYLYLHTHFSRKGGPASPSQWCHAATDLGYKSLGVADRGPLAAFPAFSKAAREAGIQPIYGMEARISLPSSKDAKAGVTKAQPAVFFARDTEGLDNLASLASIAYARWPQEEQALDWDTLAQHASGLALVLLAESDALQDAAIASAGAKELAEWGASIKECFGDAVYVALAQPGNEGNQASTEKAAAAAQQMGLPTIAMSAARYIRSEDQLAYQALQVARERAGWGGEVGAEAPSGGQGTQYLRSPDDAASLYAQWPEALENASRLAERCVGVGYLDELATESFRASIQAEKTRLRRLAEERLLRKLGEDGLPDTVQQWLDDELSAYDRQNALPAWTALASVCDAALSHDGKPAVPLGAPVGTADGSLLAFAFGISPINPVDYPRPAWLAAEAGTVGRVLPVPGVELPANRRDELLVALVRDYSPNRAALVACHIGIDPLTALSAASEVLGTGGDVRPLALQAMSQGWNALAADQAGGTPGRPTPASLALSLKGAPVTFKPDPDMLLLAPVQGKLPGCLPVLRREGQPGAWVPVTEEAVAEMRLPAVMLRPSPTLSALASTLTYAAQYPVPGLAVEELDLAAFPPPSTVAAGALARGELVGVPYLTVGAVKGWKGELTPADAAALVARSLSTGKPPTPPKLDQWTEQTAGTGGALLFRDQFEALVTATSGFSPIEAYSLRVALLRADADGSTIEMKERFAAGCAANGLDAESIETLWQALAASAPDLQSRCSIAARARASMWAAFFKAEHPAAYLAAHLAGSMDRGGVPLRALLGEAGRLKVGIKPPDASHSMPAPTLERGGSEWTILWGLALLPGWTRDVAHKFVAARPRGGFVKMADFALAAVDAGLTQEQLESLVLAGGCDTLGGQARSREALIETLPAFLEWARAERGRDVAAGDAGPADLFSFNDAQPPAALPDEKPTLGGSTLTPRERYLRRAWEVAHIGAGFTPAGEIEALKRTLDSSHLHSRLLRSVQVGEEHVGKSVNLVGLLTHIRLVSPPASNGNTNGNTNGNGHPPAAADTMSVAWVEDTEGAIELVAFPPGYKRHAELWTENSLVIVT
ncbi:MAG TPA: PHP domain-containing protein, partial [Chloroflexia bacterium]|nr:PHP domain-containing protein [Chloroflexia bacterium]